MRFSPFEVTVAVVVVGASAVFVGSTLDRPTPPTFRITEARFSEAGETLVGPRRYTVDARDPERWVHFDFSRGAVVPPTDDADWDLAFNRSNVIANGGEGFEGSAGIVDLGAVPFDSVRSVPGSGYVATTASRDSVNEALADWYDYSFTSHLLLPKPHVYAIRTADGRFAKLRFLGYYCEGVIAGCMTFEYVYQGAGGRTVAPAGPAAVSLLGEPLRRPELPPEVASEYRAKLDAARADLDRTPEDADALVWYGRRLAYLGRYRDAIEVYTRGIELHPEDARFLRHRGHRYVSVRELERAERDLRAAVALVDGTEDVIEPDGLPNAEGVPTSSLHFNIWYHLALAHYLQGEFEEALLAWNEARSVAHHPDGVIAASYWRNDTLRRLGLEQRADRLLAEVSADAEIIEATSYLDVLLLWKGEREVEEVTGLEGDALANATTAYGVGAWHFLQGRRERAYEIWEAIVERGEPWAAFGFIAAEAELARLGEGPA